MKSYSATLLDEFLSKTYADSTYRNLCHSHLLDSGVVIIGPQLNINGIVTHPIVRIDETTPTGARLIDELEKL